VSNPSCKLLLVDSDAADAALAGDLLRQSFPHCELVIVTDAVAFAEQLSLGGFAAVVSEQALGWASGMDALAAIAERYPQTVRVLFAKSLPPNIRESGSGLSAVLKKDEAGFLKLADAVDSALRTARMPGCHAEKDQSPPVPVGEMPVASNDEKAVEPVLSTQAGQPPSDHLYLLRKKAAEVFLRWRIASRNSARKGAAKKGGKSSTREARMLKEEFAITWDEKKELYEFDAQLALLNARYLQTRQLSPIDPDDYLAQVEKIRVGKRQAVLKYRKIRDRFEAKWRKSVKD